MIKECLVCGNKFKTYTSKIKLGRGKYCSKKCSLSVTGIKKGQRLSTKTEFKKGELPYNYKGFRHTISRSGGKKYKLLYMPKHPNCTARKYIREHRYVMEQYLGRYLSKEEIVHHKDGDTLNNNINNLEVMYKKDHDRMNTPLNIHRRWNRG